MLWLNIYYRREIHSCREVVHFISVICPVHSPVVVDRGDDNDNNHKSSFSSSNTIIVAVVYCDGVNLNEAILDVKLVIIESYATHQNLQAKNGLRRIDANTLLH